MTPDKYLESLLNLPGMWGARVSHDGRWVAWTWFRTAPVTEVYVAPTDGSAPPTRLTDTPENTSFVSWAPDSKAVIVEQDKDGNERAQLFRVDIDTPLVMTPLTEEDPNFFIRGGHLHPNGRWLVYGANVDPDTGQEIEPTCIYRHDLTTGERILLARPEKGGWVRLLPSPTGERVLYPRMDRHPAGVQCWVVDIDGQNDREILNFGDTAKAHASWCPDGERLVVRAETDTQIRLGLMTLADGEITWLIAGSDRNIEDAYMPHGSDQIVVVEAQNAKTGSFLLDPDTGKETHLPEVPGDLILLAPAADGGDWVALYYSSRQPVDVVRLNLENGDPASFVSLTRVWERTDLTPDDLAPAQNFTWKAEDGLQIQGWLYRPEGEAKGTVVFVHGGPTFHSWDAVNNQIQYFVHQGFNVLDVNYRGSTGFSLAYREAIKEDGWGGREQTDIRVGIEMLIEAGIAQPGKIGITGTSFGGYSSWHAITHMPPDLLAASAPICGMTDLVVDYQTTRPDLRPYSEEMMGGSPDTVPEIYYERSPINFVSDIKGRLLIIQGMQDPNVTPENVRTVVEALQKAGIEYELLAFDDEGHGISKPKNQKVLYERVYQFFQSAFEG